VRRTIDAKEGRRFEFVAGVLMNEPRQAARKFPGIRLVRPEGRAHSPAQSRMDLGDVFTRSDSMRAIRRIIEEVADTTATVLIRGESGVGKDLIARAIASASQRRDQPFVKVNCAALPAELLESELFGHEKGAFTGAYQRKLGKFEFAQHGSLFLDEIGELPLPLQAKLLHVLQDREFFRIGGRDLIQADTRIIASTNRDLEAALRAGQFREDLYYRLNVVEIHVPPLRERREEIPALVEHFLAKFCEQGARRVEVSKETLDLFLEYDWPGNIRELENLVRRLVVLGHVGRVHEQIVATLTGVGRTSRTRAVPVAPAAPAAVVAAGPEPAPAALGLREIARRAAFEAEKKALGEVLHRVRWNRKEAARVLKVSYKTLLLKIAECGLDDRTPRRRPAD
jgi:transcriptional regulator with GAF, ATPase, and Fis domain